MTFSPRAIEAAKAIDFAKEARDLKAGGTEKEGK